ncbi:MAG: Sec-independent protein translocase protein TatB [Rhodospirillales bacterium]
MFDIGWQEIFIISVLALIVVGPKDLPRVLKTVMAMVRKARGLAADFQSGINEVVREAELEDLKKQVQSSGFGDLDKTIRDTVDPDGELEGNLDMKSVQGDLDKAAKDASKAPKKTNKKQDG